jgi:hypothetical protein
LLVWRGHSCPRNAGAKKIVVNVVACRTRTSDPHEKITPALALREQLTGSGDKAGQDFEVEASGRVTAPSVIPSQNLRSDYDDMN